MKSVRLTESPEGPVLVEHEGPRIEPRDGEVLVLVRAAGVTPTELLWYPTTHQKNGDVRTGAVPAHEFSGEIAELGPGVEGLSAGAEVYGMNDWFADGALAEVCITRPEWIAPKPRRLNHAEAATVPIGALTAWQGLFDRADLKQGERVLVHGGTGAVGVFALQLAKARGARVITTVSTRHVDFARELGADEVIDYKAARFEETVRDVDVVFDCVGGETLKRSWSVLREGGRMVTVAADGEATVEERVKQAFFIVEPRRDQLIEIATRIDAGSLRVVLDTVAPLSQAGDAFAGRIQKSGRGKVVIEI